ncbi:hypothetical protein AAU61_13725 [Desulfocarbo indianensis]|nr:hypothetical protein AAU61_13725 [Desulfocarbo indianensis]
MNPAKKIKIALLCVALTLCATPCLAQGSCRRAVVVYVDISGSMYENQNRAEAPWSQGKRLTLMENTVRFLEQVLLAEGSEAIKPGDRLVIRGFYSLVGSLLNAIDSYDPKRDAPKIRDLDQKLDFSGNKSYGIADAVPERSNYKTSNPFLAKQDETLTDFTPVVLDMMAQYQLTPLGTNPHEFDELVFIVLTDGGHDKSETLPLFHKELQNAAALMRPNLDAGRVKVLIFGMGDYSAVPEIYGVRQPFKKWLAAADFPLDPSIVGKTTINSYFAKVANRIQIERAGKAQYDLKQNQLAITATFHNHSCHPRKLEAVRVRLMVHQDGPATGGPETAGCLAEEVMASGVELPPRSLKTLEIKGGLSQREGLAPGAYAVAMVPLTQDVGQGAEVQQRFEVAPPAPDSSGMGVFAVFITLAIGGGVLFFMIMYQRSRRQSGDY